jgi:hypothetical protein
MARNAVILGTIRDAFGDAWDVRETKPTNYGFPIYIGWPVGIPRGRGGSGAPRTIPTTKLVALLEKYRMRPSELRLPISFAVVKRLRKMLGHNRYSDSVKWWEDNADELTSMSLTAFAEKHNVALGTASIWHTRLFGRKIRPAGWWCTKEIAELLLSDLPRVYKAEKLGCSLGTIGRLVWATRQRIG